MKQAKYTVATIQLANKLATHEACEELYTTLRRAVYGTPANVDATDLVHAMAEIMGKSDPSEPD